MTTRRDQLIAAIIQVLFKLRPTIPYTWVANSHKIVFAKNLNHNVCMAYTYSCLIERNNRNMADVI